ncbi:MAG: FAD-dependent thymidylate synthase [Candidatus Gracilibacteria bacterium]|nr:FAD-dependent thymidylate synthase [Candidatus Gracilibacteria bacterium]
MFKNKKNDMTITGTLTPLIPHKDYTESEKIVLLHFFTNIDKNIYCATNNLSNQLWAFLVGQYSRSHVSLRDRFLKLFDDTQKMFEDGKITKEDYISVDELASAIKSNNNPKLEIFEKKASDFLYKWGVQYGHNSLKDADRIRYVVEGVSQVFTKFIEAPFPCLGDFQEKSTRYLEFSMDKIVFPPELVGTKYETKAKELLEKLFENYKNMLPIVRDFVVKNNIIDRDEFSSEGAYMATLNAKIFDITRYFLPNSVSTALGASFSTRTLETHLSWMLSSPLEEIRTIAQSMYEEGIKLSPGLLRHVKANDFEIKRKEELANYVRKNFTNENLPFYKGIRDSERVQIVRYTDIDNEILASLVYYNARGVFYTFEECLEKVKTMSQTEKEKLMELALKDRGEFDRMPREIQHGAVLAQFIMDFAAYRDLQRHRATKQLRQGACGIIGYDYPEFVDEKGMEEYKAKYDEVMTEVTAFAKELVKEYPYATEYISAFGNLVSTTYEMDYGQVAYIAELRTTPHCHQSYRTLTQEFFRQFSKIAPIYSKYIKADMRAGASRKEQEEKAEAKRKKLLGE